ncbi:MAG: Gfo/Idh/MocA family oxidoreductase, partial [Anaerolineae bacterium]|nr:Gfo/Idh/MocA family oxidoreductase [Anaerolineae bacterium]
RVGIIGCGLIGRRRATVVGESAGDKLVIVADVVRSHAEQVARENGCLMTTDWREVVSRDDLDAIIVSTTNDWLAPISIAAARNGKHVLCEKPLARNPEESWQVVEAARASKVTLKTGFNHRHHAAIWKAYELSDQGAIGEIYHIRCHYGHGGRPGYDREWRTNPEISGGGELLDQGIHALDLFRWFLGDFEKAVGFTTTSFWKTHVEDNAFALLRTNKGQVASLHASWTQWKNLFSFEIFGRDGYLIVQGLGGSYGLERLVWGKRLPESGPPEEKCFDFPGPDLSWEEEWREFVTAIREDRKPLGSGYDGWQALRLAYAIYESAATGCVVKLTSA